jgi:polygalacturonase
MSNSKTIKIPMPKGDLVKITEPTFPDKQFIITDYSAVPGDSVINTKAFADAIRDCRNAGGGKVVVPPGKWNSGPIHLAPNVNLHLQAGSILIFNDDFEQYLPPVFSRYEGIECYLYSPCIYAKDCDNIAITGSGMIESKGQKWWDTFRQNKHQMVKLWQQARDNVDVTKRVYASLDRFLRPNFIQFINCDRVLVEGVTIGSGPMWTVHPVYCEDVIVRDVTFINDGPNNDGVDPDSSRDVLVENCRFDTADDAIAIKSGRDHDGRRVGIPCENIIVRNCQFGMGKPCDGVVSIGSEMSGDVRNVLIEDCDFLKTGRAVRIKSQRGRGGVVENIWIRNITAKDNGDDAILLNCFYTGGSTPRIKGFSPQFKNIFVENIESQGSEESVIIRGLTEQPITNVVLKNIKVKAEYGLKCTDADHVKLINVNIAADEGPIMEFKDSEDIYVTGSKCPANTDVFVKVDQGVSGLVLEDNDLTNARKVYDLAQGVSADSITVK